MKRILLILLTFSVLFSCDRKALLESTDIPSATEMPDDPNEIDHKYARVELDTQAVDGDRVFGGFRKRFQFKGSWYVLADYMYKYNPASKSLSIDAKNIILKIDDEKSVNVYAKNLLFNKYGEDIVSSNSHDKHIDTAWFNLNKEDLVITDSEVFHEDYWYNYYRFDMHFDTKSGKGNYTEHVPDDSGGGRDKMISPYATETYYFYYTNKYPTKITLYSTSRGKTYTTDLINWQTENDYDKVVDSIVFPFNGARNINVISSLSFKNNYYIFYQSHEFGKNNSLVDVEYMYSRMDYNTKKWESVDLTYKFTYRDGNIQSVRIDNNKIYIKIGNGDIYSTADGNNWYKDNNDNFNNAQSDYELSKYSQSFPKINAAYAKKEPDWAKVDNYYYSIYSKPIYVPTNMIRLMADMGETNYILTDEDINLANVYLLQVASSTKDILSDNNKKILNVLSPIYTSHRWMGGSDFLFSFNGKLMRLVDYANTRQTDSYSYEALKSYYEFETWRDKALFGGTDGYSVKDCHYNAMLNKSLYDAYSLYTTNSINFLPEETVSYYRINFKY